MYRIYDAAFATATGTSHQHLGTFWWVDDSTGLRGQWTRQQAYDFVITHAAGFVYVREGNLTVTVRAYHDPSTGTNWIQTEADGRRKDNLTTLAERHRRNIPNF